MIYNFITCTSIMPSVATSSTMPLSQLTTCSTTTILTQITSCLSHCLILSYYILCILYTEYFSRPPSARRIKDSRLLRSFFGLAPTALYASPQAVMCGISTIGCFDNASRADDSATCKRVSLVVSLGPGEMPSTIINSVR